MRTTLSQTKAGSKQRLQALFGTAMDKNTSYSLGKQEEQKKSLQSHKAKMKNLIGLQKNSICHMMIISFNPLVPQSVSDLCWVSVIHIN
jgi:hypothetical protein